MIWSGECKDKGYQLIGTGEMGIGNTTTSSMLVAALTGRTAEEVTGRGAGLNDAGLLRKQQVIAQALEKYEKEIRSAHALSMLAAFGGLDIAGMAGVCIGGALYHVPVVLDGLISSVAALVAERIVPGVREFVLPSHLSKEPAAKWIAEELNLHPVIDAGLGLGEGTGAVMLFSLLDLALALYEDQTTFDTMEIAQYERYGGNRMITLVLGGSGSGKSAYAEHLLDGKTNKYYIATMQVYDAEGEKKKVARHRRLRAGKRICYD